MDYIQIIINSTTYAFLQGYQCGKDKGWQEKIKTKLGEINLLGEIEENMIGYHLIENRMDAHFINLLYDRKIEKILEIDLKELGYRGQFWSKEY